MKKIKHSKYKNTGMLFELIVRQVTADIISGNDDSKAQKILKKHFNRNSELFKEYNLYKTLSEEKFTSEGKCNMLINAVLKAHKSLDKVKLNNEKYQLNSVLRETFDIDSFFQTKVQNYKLLASVYKILEYAELDSPAEITRSKVFIIENMMLTPQKESTDEMDSLRSEPKEVRLMAYKFLLEKFNTKYDSLTSVQKNVLREYVGSISNTNNFLYFVQSEAEQIHERLKEKLKTISDTSLTIKLNEAASLLERYSTLKKVDDSHVTALLRYHDIINDLG